jgi:hypothetical protein
MFLATQIKGVENLLVRLIQYALKKIHRRRLRPKSLFYLIDRVLKQMPQIEAAFNAFRVVITGKLQGGTARTNSFSAGFGRIPHQSLDQDVRQAFGDVFSKYGQYGVKVLT